MKWNNDHNVSYPSTGASKLANIVEYFKELSNQLEDIRDLIYSFTNTMTSEDFFELMFTGTPNDYLEKKEDCDSFYQSLEDTGTDMWYLNTFGVENKKVHAQLLINCMRAQLGMVAIEATQDIGNMTEVLSSVKEEVPAVINKTGEKYKSTTGYDKEIVKIISSLAGFYINFIPTYIGKLSTSVSGGNAIPYENNLAHKHLIDNLTAYTNAVSSDTISYEDDNKVKLVKLVVDDKTSIERQFNNISEEEGKPMYITNSMGYYKWNEYINKAYNISTNKYEDKDTSKRVNTAFDGREYTKDDCSGFVLLVNDIRLSKDILNGSKLDTNTLKNTSLDAYYSKQLYAGNDETETEPHKGYICFEMTGDKWVAHKSDGTNEDVDEKDMGVSFLRPGDLLVTDGHAEYYVGDGYTVKYVNPNAETNIEVKKTGIASITIPSTFTTPNIKAVGTFSWGSVKDEFPVESGGEHGVKNYFYYNSDGHYFQHCECGNEPDKPELHIKCDFSKDNKHYTVIWRKQ